MLSDEEREALRNFKSEYESCDHYSSDLIIELDDAEIILNLIEKQSKEIEELKEKEKNLLIQLKDSEKELLEVCEKLRNSVSKDKIKAKIEEVKDGTFDGKIVLQSLLRKEFPVTITKEELEKRWKE